jgi:hypothetical protein
MDKAHASDPSIRAVIIKRWENSPAKSKQIAATLARELEAGADIDSGEKIAARFRTSRTTAEGAKRHLARIGMIRKSGGRHVANDSSAE